jgi:hypothetical protein
MSFTSNNIIIQYSIERGIEKVEFFFPRAKFGHGKARKKQEQNLLITCGC